MNRIDNKVFSNRDVTLDGTEFVGCTFKDCTFVYEGGETSWLNCQFLNCRLECKGVAWRTRQLLAALGLSDADFHTVIPEDSGKTGFTQ
jgi:hypothetical protein